MPVQIWPKNAALTPAAALHALVKWLVNTSATFTIKQAYSSAAAGNTVRAPTAPGSTVDNAAWTGGGAGFAWITGGTLVASDWIVLESTNAGSKWQLYLEYQSATNNSSNWFMYLIPKADYVVIADAAGVVNAALPATSIGGTSGTPAFVTGTPVSNGVNPGLQAAGMTYSAITDGAFLHVLADDGTQANRRWLAVGKVASHPDDTYPFVIRMSAATAAQVGPVQAAASMAKLSQVDGATLVTAFDVTYGANSSALFLGTAGQDGIGSKYVQLPWMLHATAAGQAVTMVLPYCWQGSVDLASSGTLDTLAYVQILGLSGAHIVLTWDGVTAYP